MTEETLSYIFTPGVDAEIFLPINGTNLSYESSLVTGLSGALSLSACYDKYGVLWKWSTFETGNPALPGTSYTGLCSLTAIAEYNNNVLGTGFIFPSSWGTVQCSLSTGESAYGTFPKKWIGETPLSADLFNKFPTCSVSVAYWTLSSESGWDYSTVIPLSVSEIFPFILRLDKDGLIENTVKREEDTKLSLNVQVTGTCVLSSDGFGEALYFPVISETYNFTSIAPPNIKIYTPNRFVLTGVNINFENLITKPETIQRLEIDFDDGKTITLTGDDIKQGYLTQSYNVVGSKTIKFTTFTNNAFTPFIDIFPNIIQVVDTYDNVFPTEYRSDVAPITLPWPVQPRVEMNDWAIEDNINNCIKKFSDNLNYLESRGRYYPGTYSDYFGWLGPIPAGINEISACEVWTWNDADCFTSLLPYDVTWRDVLSAETPINSGRFANCGTWLQQECGGPGVNPSCEGKYCVNWNWRDRAIPTLQLGTPEITWKDTILNGPYQKRWYFEPCATSLLVVCDEGLWNVNIPKLDDYYNEIVSTLVQTKCIYSGVASRNNNIFISQKTEVRFLSSDRDATLYNTLNKIDDVLQFTNIKSVCIDSTNKVYILDSTLSQVAGFIYRPSDPRGRMDLYVSWGGFGTAAAKTKFSNPNDLYIDRLDNIWVTDTGNNCVKQYSNSGSWLLTLSDDFFRDSSPLSVCVDSLQNVHVLTQAEIRVYTYTGTFLYSYDYKQYSSSEPRKINSSYNGEIVYVAFNNQVLKFFRNGVFAGYIIENQLGVRNIHSIYHDEYRNLLITTDDKVLKYCDLMTIERIKGDLPSTYWPLKDLYIHKEEYVQNWVYTKTFQRMWDNIELFRNTLRYKESGCQSYRSPIHEKEKMIIGQNELVTASTVNRVLGYLWDNFNTLINHFDPSCDDRLQV